MLAAQLHCVDGLAPAEAAIILEAAWDALHDTLHRKLSRLLILELNAARVEGRLQGDTPQARWDDFIETASGPSFWRGLHKTYPTVKPRVERIIEERCEAALLFARHWAADRQDLDAVCGAPCGALESLAFAGGDAHNRGKTVALLKCAGGQLAYKPRSLAVDAALSAFIAQLETDAGQSLIIRVPQVVDKGDHGWAAFIPHEYASGPEALARFYQGVGQWLALMRLLGGTDLHAENLIAHGDRPIIVDSETLFTPKVADFASGFGDAADKAGAMVSGTVLAVGLLPSRAQGLAFRGVDISGVGSLPGEQPTMTLPTILDAGTDHARVGEATVLAPIAKNHPAPDPALSQYWPHVLDGFDQIGALLRRLDGEGVLEARLAPFKACPIRVVVRATEVYAEISRMLWHPVSLANEGEARARAKTLLSSMAENISRAPSDPDVIDAEIEDLLGGDIPYFSTLARDGVLTGPGGQTWLAARDLVDAALADWREADLERERHYVRTALVSAYVNDGWMPSDISRWPEQARAAALDQRRRREAAAIMRQVVDTALWGEDGTVAWIAPTVTATGAAVQPIGTDLYGGVAGIALLAGAWLTEQDAGRADPVDGVAPLFQAALRTLQTWEDKHAANKRAGVAVRPPLPGGYLGLASHIWTLVALFDLGLVKREVLERASALARELPEAIHADEEHDILSGTPGAIPPLLALARRTGADELMGLARLAGDTVCERASWRDGRAFWRHERWTDGIGGFGHGVTGVGWALDQLAQATGEAKYRDTARGAHAFEADLFDTKQGAWTDLRRLDGAPTARAWCHGSVGIGLAHLDLDPALETPTARRIVERAAAATWPRGFGWNHCACHGDASALELLDRAIALNAAPEGVTRDDVLGGLVTSLEDHGASCGLLKDAFAPGLLPGLGGVAYQLLRADPRSVLPSILTLGGRGF